MSPAERPLSLPPRLAVAISNLNPSAALPRYRNWRGIVVALIVLGVGMALLAWTGARAVFGDTAYFAGLMVLWYVPIFLLLTQLGIGMDWVEASRPSPPSAAALGAAIGAAYCGLPTALLFTVANTVAVQAGEPSEFAQLMSRIAVALVLPFSILIGAAWGTLLGQSRSGARRMKWHVRVLTGQEAETQADLIQTVLAKYRLRGQATAASAPGPIVVRNPELGEAIIADLWRAGIDAEVVDAPE